MTDAIRSRSGPGPAVLARRARQFREARRHSVLVRLLRWLLPAGMIVAGGAFGASHLLSGKISATVENVAVSADSARLTRDGLVMDKPRITGATAKGQRFEVRAAKAWQNPKTPKLVNFSVVEAEMGLKDGGATALTAQEGLYDSERETLSISGAVQVRSDAGYAVEAQSAFVDFAAGLLRTENAVVIENKDVRIEASAATAMMGERRIDFMGPVKMIVRPHEDKE